MKQYTQKMFDALPSVNGIKHCPTGDYSKIEIFGEGCSFGKGCSFGEGCSFASMLVSILRAILGDLTSTLTLELMRRDAWSHPHPELFDKWALGGGCPYKISSDRMFFFQEKKELWRKGKPQMKDSDLIIAICKEKGWKIKGYLE